jgi:hypothetical protein
MFGVRRGMLCRVDWSCVVIDPKGELAAHTAVWRAAKRGHKVIVVDPFRTMERNYPRLFARRASAFFHASSCWRRKSHKRCQLKAWPSMIRMSGFAMSRGLGGSVRSRGRAVKKINGALRIGCSGKNRPLIVFQNLDP